MRRLAWSCRDSRRWAGMQRGLGTEARLMRTLAPQGEPTIKSRFCLLQPVSDPIQSRGK